MNENAPQQTIPPFHEPNADTPQIGRIERVDPAQQHDQKVKLHRSDVPLTTNPGNRINESKMLEEKVQQVAVNTPDSTGNRAVVLIYSVFNIPDRTQ